MFQQYFSFKLLPQYLTLYTLVFIAVGVVLMSLSVPFTLLTTKRQRIRRGKVTHIRAGMNLRSLLPWCHIMMLTYTRHLLVYACLMALILPTKMGSQSISLQSKERQNVGSEKVMQHNPSGINYFEYFYYFYYFDYFFYFDYFYNLYFSFRWLFYYVIDRAVCPYLAKIFGLSLWHPKNPEDLKRLLDAEVEM